MLQTNTKIKIKESILAVFLYFFVLTSLFYPFAYKQNNSVYYLTYCLPNCILVFFYLFYIISRYSFHSFKKNTVILGFKILLGLLEVVSLFFAYRYHGWYWDLINKGISLLLFYFLSEKLPPNFIYRYQVIPFTIICLAIMSYASIYLYYNGIEGIDIGSDLSYTIVYHGGYSDTRLKWLFFHKSIYSLILLLALGVTLRSRKLLFHPILWIICLAGITWALLCTSTVTDIFGMCVIYAGFLLSLIPFKRIFKKHPILIVLLMILLIGACLYILAFLFLKITASRNLSDLGSRLPIWQASIEAIQQNPLGIGMDFEKVYLYHNVNNCHNVFLNEMFRFSIPVGFLYFTIFIYLFLKSGFKQGTFSFCIWTALFLAWCMDYCMRVETLSLVIFLIYFALFFPMNPKPKKKKRIKNAS